MDNMVAEANCLKKGKTDFLVGTALGSFLLNVGATVSVSVLAYFVKRIFPNLWEALRRTLRRRWHPLAKRINRIFRVCFNRASTDEIADSAIDDMLFDIEQGRLHERMVERRQWQNMVPPNNHHVPTDGNANVQINVFQLNISLNNNVVDTERAQNFIRQELPRHRLFQIESANLLLGSRLISARFRIPEHAQHQVLQEDLENLAKATMMLDENATLQIGGLTFIHKDEQGKLTISKLSNTDVPIISSVTNVQGRVLMVKGCFLGGCEFKASTSSQCTNLRVFKEVKLTGELEVVFAHVPEADELLLDEQTYIYAYKSVVCGAKSVIVRSESELIQPPERRPIDFVKCLSQDWWLRVYASIIIFYFIMRVSLAQRSFNTKVTHIDIFHSPYLDLCINVSPIIISFFVVRSILENFSIYTTTFGMFLVIVSLSISLSIQVQFFQRGFTVSGALKICGAVLSEVDNGVLPVLLVVVFTSTRITTLWNRWRFPESDLEVQDVDSNIIDDRTGDRKVYDVDSIIIDDRTGYRKVYDVDSNIIDDRTGDRKVYDVDSIIIDDRTGDRKVFSNPGQATKKSGYFWN